MAHLRVRWFLQRGATDGFSPIPCFLVEEPVQPTDESDRRAIAARVRAIIGSGDEDIVALDMSEVDSRLRVDEATLLMTIDPESPHPDMDVLLAVIREYGVDASWLLTGEYDLGTHRRSVEADRTETIEVVKDVVRRHETPLNIAALADISPIIEPRADAP